MFERFTTESPRDEATQEFLRYVRHGDLAALEELLRAHAPGAYRQAQRFLGNASDADDAVQEAWLQLVRSAKRFDGAVPFGPWLGRLVHLACLRALRARGRLLRERASLTEMLAAPDLREDDPEHAEALRRAVARLPERYRATISLHYFAHMDLTATALAMGVSANVVAVRLHRARAVLRRRLQRTCPQMTELGLASALSAMPSVSSSHAAGLGVGQLIAMLSSGAPLPANAIKLGILHQGIHSMSSHPILSALFAAMLLTGVAVPIALHAEEQSKPAPAVSVTDVESARLKIPLDPWQSADGSWDDGYGDQPGAIAKPNRAAATAFALLNYVGAGYDQRSASVHQHTLSQAVGWLLKAQQADGSFGGSLWDTASQTTALTEIYALSGDQSLREPCLKAITSLIARRVRVGKLVPLMVWAEPDGRVSSRSNAMCIIALKSAAAAGIEQVGQPLNEARVWLDEVWSNTNSKWLDPTTGVASFPASVDFSVDPPVATGSDPASALAVAGFVKEPRSSMLVTSLRNAIIGQPLPADHAIDYTTIWLQTLGLFQSLDGPAWNSWKELVQRRLGSLRQLTGPLAGGWQASPDQGEPALGNVTSTATALLTEEIFLRFDKLQKRSPSNY